MLHSFIFPPHTHGNRTQTTEILYDGIGLLGASHIPNMGSGSVDSERRATGHWVPDARTGHKCGSGEQGGECAKECAAYSSRTVTVL